MALARPLAHRRPFFGWYLVFLAFQAQLMSWGLYFTLTYFIGPMTADLGWSATEFSTVQFLSSISFSIVLPVVGRYVDQYGGRTFMIVGGCMGAFGIASVAYVTEIWQFYLVMGLFVPFAMALYGSMVAGVALANWFHRRRGRAFALASMGTSAGGVTFGPLSSFLIEAVGWRYTWLILGAIVLVGITIPAYLLMSRRPEDVGLRPDGDAPELDHRGERVPPIAGPLPGEPHWTRAAALRTPAFWLIALSFSMSNLVIGAVLLHVIPFLGSSGLNAGQATIVATSFSAILLLVKPVYGILLERFPARLVAFASFLFSAGMIFLMASFQQPAFVILAVMGYGLAMGGSIPIEDVAWANYFGRWTIGQIRGIAYPIESLLGSVGPIIGAIVFDATGGYSGAFMIFAVAYLVAAGGIFVARAPKVRTVRPVHAVPTPAARPGLAQALVSVRPTPAAVLGVVDSLEEGVRRVAAQPGVQRGLSIGAAGVVGLSAGLLVTLISVPPAKREGAPVPSGPPASKARKPLRRSFVQGVAEAARVAATAALHEAARPKSARPRPAASRQEHTAPVPAPAATPPRRTARTPRPASTPATALEQTLRGMRRDRDAVARFARGLLGDR
jgi:MFS family permease